MKYEDCPKCLGTKVVFTGNDYTKCTYCNGQGIVEQDDEDDFFPEYEED